ncbi:MAG: class I SAM-dependent methyltransferase [Crocinitomicaceae bacterium]|nr:class I SAM-dependent methyltransferase [Crocinitomicaceae bacterium]
MSEWYKDWFNTDYYHILYKNRNYDEAESFMRQLVKHLDLKKGTSVLDLACGKGRHSIYLNKLGLDVLGIDLSQRSIQLARKYENETLSFKVHDMRKPLPGQTFDVIFNLFTSFGYFEDVQDDQRVVDAMCQNLNPQGVVIIDYLNVYKQVQRLPVEEVKSFDDIHFNIYKYQEKDFIRKRIEFEDNKQNFSFEEKVRVLYLEDFNELLQHAGFIIEDVFGDYNLSTFDPEKSERLIIKARLKD